MFLQWRLKEPEKWVRAREEGRKTGAAFGSYVSLFGEERWRTPALLGMILCVSGVIGLWGIGFFSPELVGSVITRSLKEQNMPADQIAGAAQSWIGWNSIVQNVGAFVGMLLFTALARKFGRKPVFAGAFILAGLATVAFFQIFNDPSHIWMSAIMGACQLALFAGFAIYLPELFPLRLRSTGTSFCYNVGRFIAASGPFTLGILQKNISDSAIAKLGAGATDVAKAAAKVDAFRTACSWLSLVFLLGILVLFFLPETKDRPLPED